MASDATDGEKADAQFAHLPETIPFFRSLTDQGAITREVAAYQYEGSGTEEDPYVVQWIPEDPKNPLNTPRPVKFGYTMIMAFATLAVSFISSAFSGGIPQFIIGFGTSEIVATLGLSLYVLGFAIGPLLWAPLSELYGRQILYWVTFWMFTAFNAAVCGAQNIETVIILRFFAGAFGSSPLTNAGGVIADIFTAKERGLAMSVFASAPFLGPCIGPVVGGFVGAEASWRWLGAVMALFSAAMAALGTFLVPETYPPVLLRKRAARLSQLTGKVYKSKPEIDRGGTVSVREVFLTSMSRPWILLVKEPIVLILSIYMAIIYGTLYLCFAAFPIVYIEDRSWTQGIGGLAFMGVAVGMMLAVVYSVTYEQNRYLKVTEKANGFATPEARLPPSMVGACSLPIGLFWFAWTNSPNLHWAISIAAGIPFGFGMAILFLSMMNYLIDAYTIFAASVLAASSIIRSVFGAVFPLFTPDMYDGLGIHWASSIPAFLALACVPFPFIFYKYGEAIRLRCEYAAQADAFMKQIRGELVPQEEDADEPAEPDEEWKAAHTEGSSEKDDIVPSDVDQPVADSAQAQRPIEKMRSQQSMASHSQMHNIRTKPSAATLESVEYEASPFDIDRVNTKDSFKPHDGHSLGHTPSRHTLASKASKASLHLTKSKTSLHAQKSKTSLRPQQSKASLQPQKSKTSLKGKTTEK